MFRRLFLQGLLLILSLHSFGQVRDSALTLDAIIDSNQRGSDSLLVGIKRNNKSALDDPVEYEAQDSIILDLKEKRAYLYGKAWIVFQDIKLEADYIIVDFKNKSVYAKGIIDDSTGKYVGRPNFTDDGKTYEADTMKYNFETKKGLSMGVLTTEKDGFIHGEKVLRDSLENIYVKHARFTTCNLPEPHFYIQANKIKVIPKKQIVTGPANLVIEEINTPLVVPFGFFPIPEKKSHGLIFPSFGESPDRGFYLRGLGYYFPINDYLDLQLTGDYYFRGSWGLSANTNYYKKYKYRGSLGISFNQNEIGEPEVESTYSVSNDFRLKWNFTRDAKARPGSSFGASVNFLTSNYLKNNTINYNDIISTTSTSSINYSKSLFKNKLNISATSNIYQDLSKKDVNLTLPEFTANLGRQMPFSRALIDNKTLRSFVRNFGFSYNGNFKNEVKVKEETLFTSQVLDSFRNGISHRIPVATSFKAMKWLTVSPTFEMNEFWYFKTTEKYWDNINDTLLINEDISGFSRANQFRTSISVATILYGKLQFKNGKISALRHVVRPSISAQWNPDFSKGEQYGYRTVTTQEDSIVARYNIYENGILGRPSFGPQGSLVFALSNNIEMKVRSTKDTANGGIKKIKLIESLNLGSGYNFLADSLKLSIVSINGYTTLLDKIRVTFRSNLDPYFYDSVGTREFKVDQFLWESSDKLFRLTNTSVSLSTNLNPNAFKKKVSDKVDDSELEFINSNINNYIDFNIPWSLTFNYNLNTVSSFYKPSQITQSVTVYGDISLTPNWKIGVNTGYDLSAKALSLTSFDFYRNLHCWEFSFSWYPIIRRQFEFSLRVKSSTLQDLKLNRRRSWWDL